MKNYCCPNLNLEGVGRCPHKCLDAQILFQDLKKDLDLPSALVRRGDRSRPKSQMIRQKDNHLTLLLVEDLDPS